MIWLRGSCEGSLPGAVSPVRQHKKNIYVTNHAVAAEVLRAVLVTRPPRRQHEKDIHVANHAVPAAKVRRTRRQRGNADEQVVDVPLVVRRTDLGPEAEAELVMEGVAG